MNIVLGRMQLGKTTETAYQIWQRLRTSAVIAPELVLEPQDDITRLLVRQSVAYGCEHDIIVDDLSRIDRTLAVVNIFESSAVNTLQRMQENRTYRDDLVAITTALRNIDGLQSPLIHETVTLAVEAMQFQQQFAPLHWMPHLASPMSAYFEHLLKGCADRDVKYRLGSWQFFKGQQLRSELGPMKRIVEDVFSDASVIARCGETDAFDIFESYKVICLCNAKGRGGDFLLLWWLYKAIQWIECNVRRGK